MSPLGVAGTPFRLPPEGGVLSEGCLDCELDQKGGSRDNQPYVLLKLELRSSYRRPELPLGVTGTPFRQFCEAKVRTGYKRSVRAQPAGRRTRTSA